jgi:AcrR family transcriptional regulator
VSETGNVSKERLLDAVIAYVADHGVADVSLRRLAAEIGTSHRMLIYHFGSKEGLLIAVIRAVEERQLETLTELDLDPSLSPTESLRRMWRVLSDPALWPNERLFFEVYGQALQARPHTAHFLDDIVESWLGPGEAVRRGHGVPPELARTQARLDVAMTRGLLLDLLATGDRAGADEASEQYNALVTAWLAGLQDREAGDARTATRTIESDAEPDAVFALLADPRRLPDWAPAFADAVSGDHESGWRLEKNGQEFALRVVTTHDARTVDYLREIAPGPEGGAYLRIVPRPGGGSVTSMTVPVPPGGDPAAVSSVIRRELAALTKRAVTHGALIE